MSILLKLAPLALILLAVAPLAEAASAPGDGRTAIVELFTSQGCSSCPPADRLLSKLAQRSQVQGEGHPAVVPRRLLEPHRLAGPVLLLPLVASGSSSTPRRVFHSNRIYTPQVVVNGRAECVGNQEGAVLGRIADALAGEPAGQVSLALDPPTPDGHLKVTVGAKLAGGRPGPLDLWVAVYESGLSTVGEGGGERLARAAQRPRGAPPGEGLHPAGDGRSGEVRPRSSSASTSAGSAEALGVAAFLQDPATLAIHGAAAREVGSSARGGLGSQRIRKVQRVVGRSGVYRPGLRKPGGM